MSNSLERVGVTCLRLHSRGARVPRERREIRELKSAVGLSGRARRAASSTERARIAVTQAIRLALRKIAAIDGELSKVLAPTIKTGTVCSYVPALGFPIRWQL